MERGLPGEFALFRPAAKSSRSSRIFAAVDRADDTTIFEPREFIEVGGIKTRNVDLETRRHNYRGFGFAHSRASFSEYGDHFPVGVGTGQRKLDEFEKLIRDAIALLIKRGEIKSPRKRPPDPPSKTQRSSLDKDPRE